jgi:hypothetical protein
MSIDDFGRYTLLRLLLILAAVAALQEYTCMALWLCLVFTQKLFIPFKAN